MRIPTLVAALIALVAFATMATARYAVYLDDGHRNLPPPGMMTGVTHIINAFASSSHFLAAPFGTAFPISHADVFRRMVPAGAKVCLAIGGWGDTDGFGQGCATQWYRNSYAQKLAQTLNELDYDCVDIDWEFPGGNGPDYKTIPNQSKEFEIECYPLFLRAIKDAIGDKLELSIAVPGREQNMMAYTAETGPVLDSIVDAVHVMTYDLMNRRDNCTKHTQSLVGVTEAIELYISRGFHPSKLNLGYVFYASWFTLQNATACVTPTGCRTELLEYPNGTDTLRSGAVTFEFEHYQPLIIPSNLTISVDGRCGSGTFARCNATECCSQYGSCGSTYEYCGTGCQNGYGMNCTDTGPTINEKFVQAMKNGEYDANEGAHYYIDHQESLFWSWDTEEDIQKKYDAVVKNLTLGGVFVWSLGEDTDYFKHLRAVQAAVLSDAPQGYGPYHNTTVA
ncbi:glycoside hydrolase superfamily [Rhypophila decipiens]|uniref:chitinase n=1 Tax=Rhypophila decipiens TaxID=261697 RepID=A0AAN7B476_9PEZI|nr:glycoside hydrolase superfamily [Rhypophila decipiens]